jgi:hypothetical protein
MEKVFVYAVMAAVMKKGRDKKQPKAQNYISRIHYLNEFLIDMFKTGNIIFINFQGET